jgi:hypothetical protein
MKSLVRRANFQIRCKVSTSGPRHAVTLRSKFPAMQSLFFRKLFFETPQEYSTPCPAKCHPGLAGHGVEYSWGVSKKSFRKHNDCITGNLERNVTTCLGPEVLSLQRVWTFARHTKDYMRGYLLIKDKVDLGSL